jgi:hypothetical protein
MRNDESMKTKMPKEIIVTIENVGTRDEYMAAYKTVHEAAEMGQDKVGGRYVLQESLTIEAVAKVTTM